MLKFITLIISLATFSLFAYSSPADLSNPAQSHINEYRLQDKQCKKLTQNTENTQQNKAAPKPEENTLFAINENDVPMGNLDAQVIVIEYASPTCARCAFFNKKVYPELKKNYIDTGKIAFVFRFFVATRQDLDAGILTLCGSKMMFPKLKEVLFDRQESWAFNSNYRDILTNIGQLSGIEPDQYAKCLSNTDYSDILINQSRAISRVPGFVGTPTFFINGELFKQVYTYENLSKAIDAVLKK